MQAKVKRFLQLVPGVSIVYPALSPVPPWHPARFASWPQVQREGFIPLSVDSGPTRQESDFAMRNMRTRIVGYWQGDFRLARHSAPKSECQDPLSADAVDCLSNNSFSEPC